MELKFRVVIPERNATIYFDLTDLVHPARKDLFSKRELLIPWLLAGNIPNLYTGLKDKNGKEIYEGDIISGIYNRYPQNWTVNELSEYGLTFTRLTKSPIAPPYFYSDMRHREVWEVIGNIYENKELLKED